MISEEQYQKKKNRVLKTLEVFISNEGKITDERLAEALSLIGIETSSSTVGRDLTENLEKIFIEENARKNSIKPVKALLTDEQIDIIAFVKKKRKDNKKEGHSKGGKTSTKKHDVKKDEDGKFDGCTKRR